MKKNSAAFVNQLLVCLLVTIGFGGSIGLGTVWMRHQISVTANANRALAAEFSRVERLIDEKKTVIETEQAPDKLRMLNVAMHLGLVPFSEVPVTHVPDNTTERLVRRAAALALDTDRAVPAAAPIAFKVAQH
jgi:hypothetical protein